MGTNRNIAFALAAVPGVLAALVAHGACASTIYVDALAAPGGDGLSWASAFADLQSALAAAAPGSGVDQVWVAAGRYTPSSTDATASFVMIDGVALYGGFAGNETALAERNWQVNVTVLDADIGQDDVVGSGAYWYTSWNRNTANSGHVVVASGTSATAVLDGFTVANGATGPTGTSAGDALMFGSGLFCIAGSPTIRNCTFTHCLSAFAAGGGAYLWDSNATLEHCMFLENYGHLADGGGLFVGGASAPTIADCVFQYNITVAATPDSTGGGMSSWSSLPMAIDRCDFIGNVAKSFYGVGNTPAYGGGLFGFNQPLAVRSCRFIQNRAITGGGMASFGATTVVNCLFTGNISQPQPADPYPELGGDGAAMSFYGSSSTGMSSVINCTVAGNQGKKYAIMSWSSAGYEVLNSIVWGNTASDPELSGGYKSQVGGSFDAAHSCIWKIFDPSAPGEDPIEPRNLPGCTAADPSFINATDRHVQAGSPCLDAGDNALVPVDAALDLDGAARFVDDPAANTGSGSGPLVDMGCYERHAQPPCEPADLNCDGSVTGADLGLLLGAWGQAGPGDLNADGTVDGADLGALLAAWG
jgi:hypothetical protein